MNTTVISVENLSKSYRLGQIGTGTFAYDLNVWWARLRGKPNPMLRIGEADHGNRAGEEVWALKDVSFKVQQGEVLGIIGRNGAGKSTLLKILSRVTAPTSGEIKVKGRVASLLEVGTGFHPDLTGRENVYLNGAILGMTRQEVTRKFDEIVDFAGVEKFIDTPVKRYSSGMYVRLAFAVAAHLDPEILVVDEVLAVGDAEFQKKCLGKMGEVAHGGRTVLFVSHNMAAISELCSRTLLIESGNVVYDGETRESISRYIGHSQSNSQWIGNPDSSKQMQILAIGLLTSESHPASLFEYSDAFKIRIDYVIKDWKKDAYLALAVNNEMNSVVIWSCDIDENIVSYTHRYNGYYSAVVTIPANTLAPGKYSCSCVFYAPGKRTMFDYVENGVYFDIYDNKSILARLGIKHPALTGLKLTWKTTKNDSDH